VQVDTSIAVDGTALFAPAEAFNANHSILRQRFHHLRAHTLGLKNAFEVPLTEATKLLITTNTAVNRARPTGSSTSISANFRHRYSSNLNFNLTTAVLYPHATTVKANYTPDSDSFVAVSASCRRLDAPPPLTIAFGRNIYKGLTSFMTVKTGTYSLGLWGASSRPSQIPSTLSFGLTSTSGYSLNAETSAEGSNIGLNWGTQLNKDAKVTTGGGFNLSATGEHRIPYDSWLAMIISCGSQGLVLRIRWSRLGQRIMVPIVLSREPEFLVASQLLLVPVISATLLHRAYLQPRKKRRIDKWVRPLLCRR
jgi:DnaJ family protein C protein 11